MSWGKCPECKAKKSYCVDSRWLQDHTRRRYECENGHRWSTIEMSATMMKGYKMVGASFQGENFAIVPNTMLQTMHKELATMLSTFEDRLKNGAIEL